MFSEQQKLDFASLRVEIIDMNIVAYFFIKKINRYAHLWRATTREYILEELTALRYMENGIILHLTNLDDNSSSNYSFPEAKKIINKTIRDQKALKKLNDELSDFRKNVNALKTKHRNVRIAHLNYDRDLQIDEFLKFETELKPLIIQANTIADLIWGEPINVKFRLGSLEGHIDFRKDTDNLTIDINKIKSFT